MVVRKRSKQEKLLTEVELELMNIIWGLGECTVKEVQDALPKERDLAYTSVATIMKILEQKGVLGTRKKERAHSYLPILTRTDYEAASLRHLQENVFRGDPSSMVVKLLNESELSKTELQAIKKVLNDLSAKAGS